MAFKTDTIKLKLLTSDSDADGVNGELAVVNDVLRLRSGGTWADVSSGGGGGGLANVVDDTAPELGGNLTVPAGTTIDFENNIITDTKIGNWDTAYSSILSLGTTAGTALEGNTPTISTDQSNKVDFLSVTQAVDLDDMETKTLEAHSWGNHVDANYGFSDVYQLSDLVDVDTPNTSSLGASHEGKILGVVLGGAAVTSTFSIDLSAVDETNGIISYFKFTIGGSDYEVSIETANQALPSDTMFINGNLSVGVGGARINGTNDSDTIAADIRTVFTDAVTTYWGNAYTISGTGSQAVITANVAGSASSILYNPNVSNLAENLNISSILGVNAFYQYELVDDSTVSNFNDLSDVGTPTLDASHVGKIVGAVANGGNESSITLDFSGVNDGTNIGGNIRFTVNGQQYAIFIDGGANPVTSSTEFTQAGGAVIDGVQATTNQVAEDVRVLLNNTFGNGTNAAVGFPLNTHTISGTNPEIIMTANELGDGAQYNIVYDENQSNINTAGFTVSNVLGNDPAFQYELVNASGAADPNWNYVHNSAWNANITLSANNASNLTWVNTQNPNGNELIISQPSDYGTYAVITVMNASNNTMDISTVDNSFDFNCQQLNPTQSNAITLEMFQKAILVRTSGTDWDVVIASI